MIRLIQWNDIQTIWREHLWPNRDDIEPQSAMLYKKGHDLKNFLFNPSFFGYYIDDILAGVNSGHRCCDGSYRSRGLFVFPQYRNKGIATLLLKETITQSIKEGTSYIWSYPRKDSWRSYEKAGFALSSDWHTTETGLNAFCIRVTNV